MVNVDEAYAACARLARTHYENFPVASALVPKRMRPHIAAIYAFARTADDFADEGTRPPQERLRLLDDWLARLHACVAPGFAPAGSDHDALFVALGRTMLDCALPLPLFEDLLSAFRQDVMTTRYETWADLLDYCRRSANPVGRLVLRVAGHSDNDLDRASDALCSALQLTNFWQDFARDWTHGRLYVPLADMRGAGAREDDLAARRLTPEWRAALAEMARRTRALFDEGRPVCNGVAGRLRYELRATWLGGRHVLDAIERSQFDVFTGRPALRALDMPAIAWGAIAWRRTIASA